MSPSTSIGMARDGVLHDPAAARHPRVEGRARTLVSSAALSSRGVGGVAGLRLRAQALAGGLQRAEEELGSRLVDLLHAIRALLGSLGRARWSRRASGR